MTPAQIIDHLAPVFIHHTGAPVSPECFAALSQRLGELLYPPDRWPHGLSVFGMTDQPPTCPDCGARLEIIAGWEGCQQVCACRCGA